MPDQITPEELVAMRHSAAHLLAAAVLKLWPETKPTIGPAIDDGFYYDFEFPTPITDKDLPKIEKTMRKLLPTWKEFTHEEVSVEDAKSRYRDNPYKLELIDEISQRNEPITLYTVGEFTDLCRGGHTEHPNTALKNFKLRSLAGAYWRGDEKNAMLTRIYGVLFSTSEELEQYLTMLEEAKKRDHRKLGQELDLFTFSPLVGSGLPLFTPRGTIIRRELENFLQSIQEPAGYQRVTIPHLAKAELYKTSGHWDKFKEDLFHVRGKNDEEFVMKPMNCPHHTQIYASQKRSYRELPLRYSEVTMVYRDEQAGQLQGLSRVRSITQDDGHVFCRQDQIQAEVNNAYEIIEKFYAAFNFDLSYRLSLRNPKQPEKYLGTDTIWEQSQDILRTALQNRGITNFEEAEGEAAFYGPKIDFTAKDSIGRKWQLATIQLDFNMPTRFNLTYTDADGTQQHPIMIHRAILGAFERFMSVLLEHYAGALPLWLAPVHAAILPIADEQNAYANSIADSLRAQGIRVAIDDRGESIGKKIREAQLQKVPYMLIVGKKEVEAAQVAVRSREKGDEGAQPLADIQTRLITEIAQRV